MAAAWPKWHRCSDELTTLIAQLFEARCAACEKRASSTPTGSTDLKTHAISWCVDCLKTFDAIKSRQERCCVCGLPSNANSIHACPEQWPFEKTLVGGDYQGQLRSVVSQLKFQRQFWAARALAELIAMNNPCPDLDVLIPVPLAEQRLKHRGFNQAQAIAQHLTHHWPIPIHPSGLVKTHETAAQSTLDAKSRHQNMQNVFRAAHGIKRQRIGLVDDVVTTGATASHAGRTLLDAGARSVTLITASRTPT